MYRINWNRITKGTKFLAVFFKTGLQLQTSSLNLLRRNCFSFWIFRHHSAVLPCFKVWHRPPPHLLRRVSYKQRTMAVFNCNCFISRHPYRRHNRQISIQGTDRILEWVRKIFDPHFDSFYLKTEDVRCFFWVSQSSRGDYQFLHIRQPKNQYNLYWTPTYCFARSTNGFMAYSSFTWLKFWFLLSLNNRILSLLQLVYTRLKESEVIKVEQYCDWEFRDLYFCSFWSAWCKDYFFQIGMCRYFLAMEIIAGRGRAIITKRRMSHWSFATEASFEGSQAPIPAKQPIQSIDY